MHHYEDNRTINVMQNFRFATYVWVAKAKKKKERKNVQQIHFLSSNQV